MRLLLCLVFALCCALVATPLVAAAPVLPVDYALLVALQSNRTVPSPWVLRFTTPAEAPKDRQEFERAALLSTAAVARFGLVVVDSLPLAMLVEAMGVAALPSLRVLQAKTTRAIGMKGPQHGRPLFMAIELAADAAASTILDTIVRYAPMSYHHPVTHRLVPAVHYALSTADLLAPARAALPPRAVDATASTIAALHGGPADAIGVLFFFDLMRKEHVQQHAELNAAAARLGPRVVAFATEEPAIAKRFGLTEQFSAAAFLLREVDVHSVEQLPKTIPTLEVATELGSAGAAAEFLAEYALPETKYTAALTGELAQWQADVGAFGGRSPLRKLEHTSEFMRDVISNKATISAIFVLREADKMFTKHLRTAVEFATFLRDPLSVAPAAAAALNPNIHLDTFWFDGESSPQLSAALGVKVVPSVAFILHAQGGNIAVRYFDLPADERQRRKKKGRSTEWPTAADLAAFVTSQELFRSVPGMVVLDPTKAVIGAPSEGAAGGSNQRYLFVDRKEYITEADRDNTFIRDLADGKITVDADHYASRSDKADKKKAGTPADKKAQARQAKLKAELEKKQAEKEERMRLKREADEARREKEAAKTKARVQRQARNSAGAAGPGGVKKDAAADGPPPAAVGVRPPAFDSSLPQKDFNADAKAWEKDKRNMVNHFVKNAPDGAVWVGKHLQRPRFPSAKKSS